MTPAQHAAIESALLRVAESVAKHTIQRDGWTPDDACFRVDLRESQAEIAALVEQAVAVERERIACQVESLYPRIDGSGWLARDQLRASAADIAARIRAGG